MSVSISDASKLFIHISLFRAEESDSKKFKELPKLASNLEAELHLEPLSPS
jgi:hypothetical protein